MRVVDLRASGWRNLADGHQVTFRDDVRLNVFFGDNAQGKTNLLEAIHYLSVFRSFRTTQAADLVKVGAPRAVIAVRVATRDLTFALEGQLTRRPLLAETSAAVTRAIVADGKPVRSTASVFGRLSTVLFVPEDLSLLRAAPSARRRFLDFAASSVNRSYVVEAADFQKVLRARNALLRTRAGGMSWTLLDTYDEQLAKVGAVVVERRRALLVALEPRMRSFFAALHADLGVRLSYVCDARVGRASTRAEITTALLDGMVSRRAVDLRRGHSTFGPHVDDFEVQLDGRPAREHASQGQLRSLVLAMKLSELVNVEAVTTEAPVLLLDDVPSELDPARRNFLFKTLESLTCQTILTVADRDVVPATMHRADFEVLGGQVASPFNPAIISRS